MLWSCRSNVTVSLYKGEMFRGHLYQGQPDAASHYRLCLFLRTCFFEYELVRKTVAQSNIINHNGDSKHSCS